MSSGISRKLARRYQRYINARQSFEDKDDQPKEIWERILKMSDIISAMAIDIQTNEIFPLYGLNNITRNDMNIYSREYIEMAIDVILNIDPSDQLQLLRIRNDQQELIIAYDYGTVFAIVQSLFKEKKISSTIFSMDY